MYWRGAATTLYTSPFCYEGLIFTGNFGEKITQIQNNVMDAVVISLSSIIGVKFEDIKRRGTKNTSERNTRRSCEDWDAVLGFSLISSPGLNG